jgi:hypothetical protein
MEVSVTVDNGVGLSRSNLLKDIAFTAAVTLASRALILRDRLLGRIRNTASQDSPAPHVRRCSIRQW